MSEFIIRPYEIADMERIISLINLVQPHVPFTPSRWRWEYPECVRRPGLAWVADLAPADLRATAFGLMSGAVGLMALPASLLFGLIAETAGIAWAFGMGALLALAATALILRVRRE